jgi:hypothetical protein
MRVGAREAGLAPGRSKGARARAEVDHGGQNRSEGKRQIHSQNSTDTRGKGRRAYWGFACVLGEAGDDHGGRISPASREEEDHDWEA